MLPASKILVLIVEDHPDTQSLLAEAFEQDGYEAVVAFDGDTGLSIVRERHPALVCLDLNLPRISGHEVCERIREDPALQDVAILMMSTGRSPEKHAHALDAGADVYLPKPFEMDKLLALARELVVSRSRDPRASAEHEVPAKSDLPDDELTNLAPARVAG